MSAAGRSIVAVALIAAFAGLAFSMLASPHYKAATRILIETRESVYTRPGQSAEADRPILDEEGVTSQVELVSSSDILRNGRARPRSREQRRVRSKQVTTPQSSWPCSALHRTPPDQSIEQRVIDAVRESAEGLSRRAVARQS